MESNIICRTNYLFICKCFKLVRFSIQSGKFFISVCEKDNFSSLESFPSQSGSCVSGFEDMFNSRFPMQLSGFDTYNAWNSKICKFVSFPISSGRYHRGMLSSNVKAFKEVNVPIPVNISSVKDVLTHHLFQVHHRQTHLPHHHRLLQVRHRLLASGKVRRLLMRLLFGSRLSSSLSSLLCWSLSSSSLSLPWCTAGNSLTIPLSCSLPLQMVSSVDDLRM